MDKKKKIIFGSIIAAILIALIIIFLFLSGILGGNSDSNETVQPTTQAIEYETQGSLDIEINEPSTDASNTDETEEGTYDKRKDLILEIPD